MVTIVKHEWHSHDRQYAIELDADLLSEIYPDLDEDEIAEKLGQIENGEIDVEEIVNDAWENNVDIDWDFQYDDCYSDRKGGYDVTYELGDEDSWHSEPEEPGPSHKCTKCRWEGRSYETRTQYYREDGSVIEDYYGSDEESHHDGEVCPMCDSQVVLTELGEQEEKERAARQAEWDAMDDEPEEEPYHAECTSCEWEGPEADTITIEGQMCCPECREVVWTAEQVTEQRALDLNKALEELKQEFDTLLDKAGEDENK